MISGRWDRAEHRAVPGAPDVVAGLVVGSAAARVAKAAVREAAARGARVRFVQVVPVDADEETREAEAARTFAAALRALRDAARVPVSFEVAAGLPGPLLVERSHGAGLLVVGLDDPVDTTALAMYSTEHAACDVLAVRPLVPEAVR